MSQFRLLPLFVTALAAATPACAAQVVPVPQFKFVELNSGADVRIVPGAAERVTILAGDLRTSRIAVDGEGRLKITGCVQRCPRFYHLQVEIQSPSVLPLAATSGGKITVAAGFPAQAQLFVTTGSGGSADTRALAAGDVFAAAHSGGQLLVRASNSLFAEANSGGAVRYVGTPTVFSQNVTGGTIDALR